MSIASVQGAVRCATAAALLQAMAAAAHVTPPVTFWSDGEAVAEMTPGASRHYTRDVRLTAAQRAAVHERCGWQAREAAYRFFVGRDAGGAMTGAVVFLTEGTLHGPLRTAIALDARGRVHDMRVVAASEEVAEWARRVNQLRLGRTYAGRGGADEFPRVDGTDMVASIARITVRQMRRAAVLFDVAGLAAGTTKGE